jgi:hypothetical protein
VKGMTRRLTSRPRPDEARRPKAKLRRGLAGRDRADKCNELCKVGLERKLLYAPGIFKKYSLREVKGRNYGG